ncbi:MAG: class I SAM-dependent methyltransferase [Candidatus Omnitrophica bacterium]|nr:class I SAM-dependent methyltransferase [Candidatus Omnitrophota bacterium]MDD5671344.1 class I SAM-dependent methyltransferase [Candidatus Omnitrophota bacterium]
MPDTIQKNAKQALRARRKSNLVYRQQFETFVRSTDQKQRQIQEIKGIMKGLVRRRNLLDVGAGSGEITEAIAGYFEKATVLEPNPEQAEALSARLPGVRVIQETIERAKLDGEEADLILCSHVLYYVPETKWMPVIEKMISCLSPAGKLILVLQSPEGGVPLFIKQFTGKTVNSVGLWAKLVRRYGTIKVRAHYGIAHIKTKRLEDMISIGQFMLIDKVDRKKKTEISRYFQKNHKVPAGYQIDTEYITFEIDK